MQRNKAILLLSVGHACVDVYQGSVAALVPFFVAERSYTYAAASALVLAASLLSSVAQPLFGAITDRWSLPWLIPVSTVVGGVGIALSGVQGVYGLTLVFVAISGIGVAAYHPEAARVAREASRGSHQAMAYFSTGGNVGFALAPVMVGVLVGTQGLSWTPLLVLPALVGATLTIPVLRALAHHRTTAAAAHSTVQRDDVPAFLKLTAAVIFRSITFVGLSTFISLYAQQRLGGSAAVGTAALFVLYIGGVIGSIWGGSLAHRWGRVAITRWSYLLTAVAVAGVAWTPGWAMFLFIALASVGLYVPFSLQVTLGQDYLPSRVGTASGITLGLTVSIGGIASPAIGALADATSLQLALMPLVAMPLVSWLAITTLHEPTTTMQSARTAPVAQRMRSNAESEKPSCDGTTLMEIGTQHRHRRPQSRHETFCADHHQRASYEDGCSQSRTMHETPQGPNTMTTGSEDIGILQASNNALPPVRVDDL